MGIRRGRPAEPYHPGCHACHDRTSASHFRLPASSEVCVTPVQGVAHMPAPYHDDDVALYNGMRLSHHPEGYAPRRAGHRLLRHAHGPDSFAGHCKGPLCRQVRATRPARDHLRRSVRQ